MIESHHLGIMTNPAHAGVVSSAPVGVVRRKLMSFLTMRSCKLLSSAGFSSFSKAAEVSVLPFEGDIGITHPLLCAGDDSVSFQSKFLSKLNGSVRFAFDLDKHGAPLVSLLRFFVSPSAVSRLVVPIVIDSINRVLFWSRSHIGDKIVVTGKPSVAYCYATASIISKSPVIRVVTSVLHRRPNIVGFWNIRKRHDYSPLLTHREYQFCRVTQLEN